MKKIAVIANPYIAVDKDGVPQGAVSIPGLVGRFIGANIDLTASQKAGRTRLYFPAPNPDPKKKQKGAAGLLEIEVTLDATTIRAVLDGSLLATTKEGAALCGIGEKEYLEPEKALEAEKAKALAYYRSVAGESAELQPIPQTATAAESPVGAPTKIALTTLGDARETLTLNTEA